MVNAEEVREEDGNVEEGKWPSSWSVVDGICGGWSTVGQLVGFGNKTSQGCSFPPSLTRTLQVLLPHTQNYLGTYGSFVTGIARCLALRKIIPQYHLICLTSSPSHQQLFCVTTA